MTSPAMLAEYVGFIEEEVKGLCKGYGMDFEEARRWYDGDAFPRISHVYSPNSVVKAMLRGGVAAGAISTPMKMIWPALKAKTTC